MKNEQLVMHSLSTGQRNLEETLETYAAAGFRHVEPYLGLVKAWIDDGHTVEQTRDLFESYGLDFVSSSEAVPVACFHSPDVLLPSLRAHVENLRLIHDLGGTKMIVGTDGPEQVTPASMDPVARALAEIARATAGMEVDIAIEFNASPVVKSLPSAVRVSQKADHPRVGVLFDTAHYHVTPTKLENIDAEAVRWIKHVHINDMPDTPPDLTHRDFDRVLPGEGVLDLPTILSELESHGYDEYFSIELFNSELWQLPVREAARRCYESLQPLCER